MELILQPTLFAALRKLKLSTADEKVVVLAEHRGFDLNVDGDTFGGEAEYIEAGGQILGGIAVDRQLIRRSGEALALPLDDDAFSAITYPIASLLLFTQNGLATNTTRDRASKK